MLWAGRPVSVSAQLSATASKETALASMTAPKGLLSFYLADSPPPEPRIVQAGGQVLVQDEDSSVVWGMPGQVAQAGLAEEVLPLDKLADAVRRRVGRRS